MGDEELVSLLWQWGRYVELGNRAPSNRITGSYAENIGAGSFGDPYVPDVASDEVLDIDRRIKKLSDEHRYALHMKFVAGGLMKRKLDDIYRKTGWRKIDFHSMVRTAKLQLLRDLVNG